MAAKSILVLYAGGTIGMVPGPSGLTPGRVLIAQIASWIDSQRPLAHHEYFIEALDPLIDSADADPGTWLALARRIWKWRDLVDAVVVLHGTDTLAYTASAASFFLIGFNKPVILTGAQVPLFTPGGDGEMNMLGALMCAVEGTVREVCVFFDRKLMRGNRTRKWSTDQGDAFVSPNWPELGRMEQDLSIARKVLWAPSEGPAPPMHSSTASAAVGLLKLYPGISETIITAAADAHFGGLVLELYGSGTGPSTNERMRRAVEGVAARGIPLIGVSQCFRGRITPRLYAAGQALAECGVSSGHDLTPEAALTKLTYLRDLAVPPDRVPLEMKKALAGEISAEVAS
jgi:L-asparaginase